MLPYIACAETNYIHDEAKVLSQDMQNKLEKLLAELDEKKNLRIEEVILPSLDNQEPTTVVDELAQKFDSHASKAEYRALILYVIDNGFIQIYPNQKLATILDETSKANVVQTATKKMQEKNYDEMARIGIAGVFHYFQKNAGGQTDQKSANGGNSKMMINLLLIIVVLVVVVGLIKFSRKLPQK